MKELEASGGASTSQQKLPAPELKGEISSVLSDVAEKTKAEDFKAACKLM